MADPPSPSSTLPPRNSNLNAPASSLRRRPARAFEATTMPDWSQRRNSTLSDSISDARNSIRSSTDDLFLPRVARAGESPVATEESHWHSAPLVLALLPALAGVLFKDGSAFVTDVTLLVLAAIFLNWSVRLPWDWYRSAQAMQREQDGYSATAEIPVDPEPKPELDEHGEAVVDPQGDSKQRQPHARASAEAQAVKELQIHELAALASCFVFPVVGTWLLHGIRSSLSRPSEGLVSNYNLTIFLLASEVRPFAHLLKLVQARTLHLQRVIASTSYENQVDSSKVQDLTNRLEELEAHVAEAAAARLATSSQSDQALSPRDSSDAPSLTAQAVVEARRALQPDIEALNRAVRRYEKRTALTNLQTDTRFQQLEVQTHDAIALAAAAQRSSVSRRKSYAFILIDWACACIVIPAQLALSILNLPGRAANRCLLAVRRMLGRQHRTSPPRSKSGKEKVAQGVTGSRLQSQTPLSRAPSVSSPAQQPQPYSSTAVRGSSH
ncbi:uncharacterized protein N7459_007925 [Penicillium hispanicum]|uniref:uncharacterized protein n=1 Tax=Penicillium hispanicum TaxID=1080232 RepID=UPI00254083FA|nr:uncharacterized protein N7459_007925 [Penicillium hispanicum]KAJ5573498.1 hypothetical protein N7459_007925 [Penicillium hispanicum]